MTPLIQTRLDFRYLWLKFANRKIQDSTLAGRRTQSSSPSTSNTALNITAVTGISVDLGRRVKKQLQIWRGILSLNESWELRRGRKVFIQGRAKEMALSWEKVSAWLQPATAGHARLVLSKTFPFFCTTLYMIWKFNSTILKIGSGLVFVGKGGRYVKSLREITMPWERDNVGEWNAYRTKNLPPFLYVHMSPFFLPLRNAIMVSILS